MSDRVLICTDLDGTLVPDGREPESEGARELFGRATARPDVTLAYVTGRHRALVEEAIREFSLPVPEFVIADVGTTIYEVRRRAWMPWRSWRRKLASEWPAGTAPRIEASLQFMPGLWLQEGSKQGDFKVSFYVDGGTGVEELQEEIEDRLETEAARVRLIFSRDSRGTGLLDIVPPAAGKLAAVEFLIEEQGLSPDRALFAGDSGNDLEVLASRLPSVLVANASSEVVEQAREMAAARGNALHLYVAPGGLLGMNGNYAAGVLEGLVHFLPEASEWLH